MSRKKDETGKQYGLLTVLSEEGKDGRGEYRYNCRCECGNEKVIYGGHLRSGASKSCGTCTIPAGKNHPQWKGHGEISGDFWANCIIRSRQRVKKDFNITIEYAWDLFLKQDRKCALSGIEIFFPRTNKGEKTASLDRIDSSKGYIEGNVQWVHKDVNRMKNIYSMDYFIETCKKIAANHQ